MSSLNLISQLIALAPSYEGARDKRKRSYFEENKYIVYIYLKFIPSSDSFAFDMRPYDFIVKQMVLW